MSPSENALNFALRTELRAEAADTEGEPLIIPGLTDTRGEEVSDVFTVGSGLNIQAWPGAWLRFLNLSPAELALFHVIPEYNGPCFTPVNGNFNVDGFWYRWDNAYWYKMPDHTGVWIYRDAAGSLRLQVQTYLPGWPPHWSTDIPKCGYPW